VPTHPPDPLGTGQLGAGQLGAGRRQVRVARTADLDPTTLYRILALRAEVFVVEQACVYLDQDGRDLEPDCHQLWVQSGDEVWATLRLLRDPDGRARIGRVATAPSARGQGLAAQLVTRALDLAGERDTVLNAQAHLESWYGRFGFTRNGPDFDEDGIPHVPMRLSGGPPGGPGPT
jgi:ElaA protein